jgi:hypothetical protein
MIIVVFSTPFHFNNTSIYLDMAKEPFNISGNIDAPACYRILYPILSYFLSLLTSIPINLCFYIINIICFFISGILLYLIIIKTFNNEYIGWIGLLLFFSLRFGLKYHSFSWNGTDSMAFLFSLVCFYFILDKNILNRKIYYIIFNSLGILVKESLLFIISVYICYELVNNKEKYNFKSIFILFCSCIPILIVFLLSRILIIPANSYSYIDLFFRYGIESRFDSLHFSLYYKISLGTWGILIPIFLLFNKREDIFKWIKVFGIFIILSYSTILLAHDTCRLIMISFFPFILIALNGINNIDKKYENNQKIIFIFLCISLFYFVILIFTNYMFPLGNLVFQDNWYARDV